MRIKKKSGQRNGPKGKEKMVENVEKCRGERTPKENTRKKESPCRKRKGTSESERQG